ncbi:MAG TPA: MFS transporter [Novosphingobium sp.]|nr:MFS transporter [Novosphingobium sp.]
MLCALSLLYFLLMATTFNALGLVLPFMVSELNWNWAEAGFGFTLLGLSCGLTGLVPAVMIRRIGVSPTLLSGALLLVAGFVTLSLTHGVWAYDAGTVLLGLGFSACGTVPGVYVISHSFERKSTAIGIYFSSGSLGSVAGPLLFYAVHAHASSWRAYWVIAAVLALALGLFAASFTSVKYATIPNAGNAAPPDPNAWTARAALRTVPFYVIVGAYSVFLLINTTIHSFAAQQLRELGFSDGGTASLLSAAALVGAVGSAVAGVVGEKLSARYLTILSLVAAAIGSLGLVIGAGWLGMGLFVVGLGIGLGFSYVSTAMLLLDFFGKEPNLELYSMMCMISTSAALGPALGGLMRDRMGNFDAVFVACAGFGLVLAVMVLLLRRPQAPRGLVAAPKVLVSEFG